MTRDKAISFHYEIKCHISESMKILKLINDIYDNCEKEIEAKNMHIDNMIRMYKAIPKNDNYMKFKTFLYKNSVPKSDGETGACIDSDFISNYVKMIYENIDMKTCQNCRWYKTVAVVREEQKECKLLDINMGKDFGCNKWELKK